LVFPDLQREINSKISYIGKVVSPTNRTFVVELAVPGGSKDLMPNLTTQIRIADYSKPNSIVVPINTVQKDLEGDFVFVASAEAGKQIAHKVRVKIGQVFGEQAEVLSGLKSGDQLVVTGFQDINEGEILKTQ
jgi:membrane fusion protein (multidrug efflux system)